MARNNNNNNNNICVKPEKKNDALVCLNPKSAEKEKQRVCGRVVSTTTDKRTNWSFITNRLHFI